MRAKWISNGKNWFDESKKPMDWSFDNQQKNIPAEFI